MEMACVRVVRSILIDVSLFIVYWNHIIPLPDIVYKSYIFKVSPLKK